MPPILLQRQYVQESICYKNSLIVEGLDHAVDQSYHSYGDLFDLLSQY